MRALLALLVVACAAAPIHPSSSGATSPPKAVQPAPLDEATDLAFLRRVAETRSFSLGRPRNARPTPDGRLVLFLRSEARQPVNHLFAFDVATGQTRELASPAQILHGATENLSPEEKARRKRMRVTAQGFTSFQISRDGREVLVSLAGNIHVLDLATGASHPVVTTGTGGEQPFDPHLSPDGGQVAFVRGGELWVAPVAGGAARQLTRGATRLRTHAQAEFVAQEEMGRHTGHWWSPDSRRLVYEDADGAGVEKLYLSDPANPMAAVEP